MHVLVLTPVCVCVCVSQVGGGRGGIASPTIHVKLCCTAQNATETVRSISFLLHHWLANDPVPFPTKFACVRVCCVCVHSNAGLPEASLAHTHAILEGVVACTRYPHDSAYSEYTVPTGHRAHLSNGTGTGTRPGADTGPAAASTSISSAAKDEQTQVRPFVMHLLFASAHPCLHTAWKVATWRAWTLCLFQRAGWEGRLGLLQVT